MNFFEHEERARRKTAWLVFLFACGVLGVVVATNLAAVLVFLRADAADPELLAGTVVLTTVFVLAVIFFGTISKIWELRAGGAVVAAALGGRRIGATPKEPNLRRLRNVVEEMAIASGCRVPEVYLLPERSINAFAAGLTQADAVIGVTQGAVERLSRDELQGVIAHEFSHILNGDMRLNLRLIGWLNGLFLVGMIGYWILRTVRAPRKRDGKGAGAIFLFGLALFVIGFVGVFFGRLIQMAVSRQREFLADASAVQFTRNPDGIGNALRKIAKEGSEIAAPRAAEAAHMFFGEALAATLGGLLSTHPPVEERLRRIYGGRVPEAEPRRKRPPAPAGETAAATLGERLAPVLPGAAVPLAGGAAAAAVAAAGAPTARHVAHARALTEKIPEPIRDAAGTPAGAVAVLFALLLDADEGIRMRQRDGLAATAPSEVLAELDRIEEAIRTLPAALRLPVMDLALDTLRGVSRRQYEAIRKAVRFLVEADSEISLFERVVGRAIERMLAAAHEGAKRPSVRHRTVGSVATPLSVVLSAVVHFGTDDPSEAEKAFAAGQAAAGVSLRPLPPDEAARRLDEALDELAQAAPAVKARVLEALLAAASHDGTITVEEAEAVRLVADAMGVPVPPILPGESPAGLEANPPVA